MSCNLKGLNRKGPITWIATQPKVSKLKVSHLKMPQHQKCPVTWSVFLLYPWKCHHLDSLSTEIAPWLKVVRDWNCLWAQILHLDIWSRLLIITVFTKKICNYSFIYLVIQKVVRLPRIRIIEHNDIIRFYLVRKKG